ncbi:hypothetical protein ACIPW5_26060 [Streptomyces sp. NPDC090077]|uniref:hypothetical protein n=1 Tax=Streptomyces sp. NPDC090077 TaxID=3365938 RepID=UPI003804D6E3
MAKDKNDSGGNGGNSGGGSHAKPTPPLSTGTPPPGNSDGQVSDPGSGSGKRRR